MMALDDVVPATAVDPERFKEATYRTTRWIDRCIKAHSRWVGALVGDGWDVTVCSTGAGRVTLHCLIGRAGGALSLGSVLHAGTDMPAPVPAPTLP
jgi:hypothetical protein